MISELKNKKDCYPFDVQQTSLSQTQKAVVHSIASLQICLINTKNKPQMAYLTCIESAGLIFQIGSCRVRANRQGKVQTIDKQNDQLRLLQENSYIEFDNNVFQQTSIQGTYNLPLLQEILYWVPTGLEITCVKHNLKTKTETAPYTEGDRKTYSDTIKFVEGFNNQVRMQSPSVIFASGAALGKGVIPTSVIEQEIGPQYIPKQVTYKGLRNINGIYPQVWFDITAGLNKRISIDQTAVKISLSARSNNN